ncbi:hypothetical protein LIER_26888 [Lithospermum erythrorhizon]|jgi:hypothetical protein
MPGL